MQNDFLTSVYDKDDTLTAIKAFGGLFIVLIVLGLFSVIFFSFEVWALIMLFNIVGLFTVVVLEHKRKKRIRGRLLSSN